MNTQTQIPAISEIIERATNGIKEYSEKAKQARKSQQEAERTGKLVNGVPAFNYSVIANQYENVVKGHKRSIMWANHAIYFQKALNSGFNPHCYTNDQLKALVAGYTRIASGSNQYRFVPKKNNQGQWMIYDTFLGVFDNSISSESKKPIENACDIMNQEEDVTLL